MSGESSGLPVASTASVDALEGAVQERSLGRPGRGTPVEAAAPAGRPRGVLAGTVAAGGGGFEAALADVTGRATRLAGPSWQRRFDTDHGDFLDASVEESRVRAQGRPLSVAAQIGVRRRTITVLPVLDVLEAVEGVGLPESVTGSGPFGDLRCALADVVGGSTTQSVNRCHAGL